MAQAMSIGLRCSRRQTRLCTARSGCSEAQALLQATAPLSRVLSNRPARALRERSAYAPRKGFHGTTSRSFPGRACWRAAKASREGDTPPGRLTASDLVRVSGQVKDPKVPLEVGKAAAACGILTDPASPL
jgi:hypothetical protein